jgi:hypothetical protein
MYDDGRDTEIDHGGRSESDGRYGGGRWHGTRDNTRYRSNSRRRYSRSRSRSPSRDAGRPSDTVILEGLPLRLPANEVGALPI